MTTPTSKRIVLTGITPFSNGQRSHESCRIINPTANTIQSVATCNASGVTDMSNKIALGLLAAGLVAAAVVAIVIVLVLPTAAVDDSNGPAQACAHRAFDGDSTVCVCNSSYCDTLTTLPSLSPGEVLVYTSSKAGLRFEQMTLQFRTDTGNKNSSGFQYVLDRSTANTYQTIIGFGGAFTDAASFNIVSLSQRTQERLMRSYFSKQGIEYNIGRIPMASCDFSTHLYTYADEPGDFEMKNFALAVEDLSYKIPLMKRAMDMSDRPIKFFGSPWSAPAWMKTNGALYGNGSLIGEAGDEYHKAWALYFARFVEEYDKNGIQLWGLTAQNEPIDGFSDFAFQCMAFTAAEQRDFVKTDLGPTLHSRGHGDLKLMIGDDQRPLFPNWAITVLNDTEAAKYVSGIGVHWYMDMLAPPSRLSETHDLFPDHFILGTEACTGAIPFNPDKVKLGDWTRGERYSRDMMQDLNNWVTGWVDWNLALDEGGGPNWVKNFVDAPIIVNADADEFYKQPMYYHMGHFSKFIVEGAKRIEMQGTSDRNTKFVAFYDEIKNTVTLVVLNAANEAVNITVTDKATGFFETELPARSISTFVWLSM